MARALAEVDLGAISRNCTLLAGRAQGASLCAVVKADGYGHGMLAAASAALAGGATSLATAGAAEALQLRREGLHCRVLVMGAVEQHDVADLAEARCDLAVWSSEALEWARVAPVGMRVHVKLDTGMGRLGTRDVAAATRMAQLAHDDPSLELAGVMTHFATAEEDDDAFLRIQNRTFGEFVETVKQFKGDVTAHAANSAATLRLADSHYDMVRCGVAVYGLDPFQTDPAGQGLEPALALKSWIAAVKEVAPGQSVGYGRRFQPHSRTFVATVPIGYADGVPRAIGASADCLIGGVRVPIVGAVSMDNITVDLGPQPAASVGDEVVLIGSSGEQRVLIEEWAHAAGTINYEIATGIGGRAELSHGGLE